MALIIPPGFAQAAYRFGLAGDPELMISTMGVGVSGGGPAGQALAEALANNWLANWLPSIMANQYSFRGVVVRVGQDGGPPVVFEAQRNVVGTNSGAPLPQNVAILIKKATAIAGRRGRGRCYLPPFAITEGDVSANGMISSAGLTFLQDRCTDWMNDGDFYLLHDAAPGQAVPAPTPITNLIPDGVVATQRRRLRR